MVQLSTIEQLKRLRLLQSQMADRTRALREIAVDVAGVRSDIIITSDDPAAASYEVRSLAVECFTRLVQARNTVPVTEDDRQIPFVAISEVWRRRAIFYVNLAQLVDGQPGFAVHASRGQFTVQHTVDGRVDYYQVSENEIVALDSESGLKRWGESTPVAARPGS